jgi:glycosyltransferase involved in cell wall biosynthesis
MIVHVVPSLEERHGGPSRSVRALANAMARGGAPCELVATGEVEAPAADAAPVRAFPRVMPRWLTRSPQLAAHLLGSRADVIHNHALWLLPLRYAHAAAQGHGVPLVVSPRGMLSDWAFAHNGWKKRLAGRLVHPGALAGATGWHATSADEADEIRRRGFTQPICVSPNGVDVPSPAALQSQREYWLRQFPAARDRRVALFYSRLHRKKRVRELLDLWLAEPRGDWLLAVVGVPEEYGVAEIRGWIDQARAGDRVVVADGSQAPAPYRLAEVFLLPSHSENFGLVVAEALAAGVPALVTDTTPWSGLRQRCAGACVPWERYAVELRTVLSAPPPTLRAMGEQGREWMQEEFSWDRSARLLTDFYATLAR